MHTQNHETALALGLEQRRQFLGRDEVGGEEVGADQQHGDPSLRQCRPDLLLPPGASMDPGIVPEDDLLVPDQRPEMDLDPLQPRRIGMAVRDEDAQI